MVMMSGSPSPKKCPSGPRTTANTFLAPLASKLSNNSAKDLAGSETLRSVSIYIFSHGTRVYYVYIYIIILYIYIHNIQHTYNLLMYYVHSHRSRCMEYNVGLYHVGLYRICIKPSNFWISALDESLQIGWKLIGLRHTTTTIAPFDWQPRPSQQGTSFSLMVASLRQGCRKSTGKPCIFPEFSKSKNCSTQKALENLQLQRGFYHQRWIHGYQMYQVLERKSVSTSENPAMDCCGKVEVSFKGSMPLHIYIF